MLGVILLATLGGALVFAVIVSVAKCRSKTIRSRKSAATQANLQAQAERTIVPLEAGDYGGRHGSIDEDATVEMSHAPARYAVER